MGKTNIPDKFIDQRGSRRLYALDLPFREAMKKRPAREDPDYSWRKQSEFKKPYKSPNYQAMEYRFDAPPGFDIDWPDWGGGEYPPYLDGAPEGVWNANFLRSGNPCYCPGVTKCFDLGCTWQVIAMYVIRGRISVTGRNYACITAPEDFHGTAEIQILQDWGEGELLQEGKRVYGSHVMIVEECDESECCACGGETIGYTTQDMTSSTNQGLTITGKTAGDDCYEWEISGSGFAFDEVDGSQTTATGGSVTLYAPSENEECEHSGTSVSLKCNGITLDSIIFSVSENVADTWAAYYKTTSCEYRLYGWCGDFNYGCWNILYNCFGDPLCYTDGFPICDHAACCEGSGCVSDCLVGSGTCGGVVTDVRAPAMITAGCCPSEVL